jgi:pyruvate formate lyase activating enzyme
VLSNGQHGFCYLRYNDNGTLKTRGYERTTGLALDPIEKKPFYHVYPRKRILSLGTVGCNMGCKYCQNWDISKNKREDALLLKISKEQLVAKALELKKSSNNLGLAFTYNEPTIWGEWIIELSALAKSQGLISVMVTNGYITKTAIHDVYRNIDCANIDLKSFSEDFYSKLTLSNLKPVLDAILLIKKTETWIELTTLIIPGYNDSENELKELCSWVVEYCGNETPLHFTAFHPDYRMIDELPTPYTTLKNAYNIGREAGLKYVYTGNVYDQFTGSTYCPDCNHVLIRRNWYDVEIKGMVGNKCKYCGYRVSGKF